MYEGLLRDKDIFGVAAPETGRGVGRDVDSILPPDGGHRSVVEFAQVVTPASTLITGMARQ